MKNKILLLLTVLIVGVLAGVCGYFCGDKGDGGSLELNKPSVLNVENVVSTDREYFYLAYGDNVCWFETTIVMNEMLSNEKCDGSIESITNTFQKIVKKGNGFDTMVYFYKHDKNGVNKCDSVYSWIAEDNPLNNTQIKLSFKDAFDRVMATNCLKPNSRYCVLRREVGPIKANPQYIFGNNKAQLYVDAVTGEVSDKDPAFNGKGGFGKPLGEWP